LKKKFEKSLKLSSKKKFAKKVQMTLLRNIAELRKYKKSSKKKFEKKFEKKLEKKFEKITNCWRGGPGRGGEGRGGREGGELSFQCLRPSTWYLSCAYMQFAVI
jgi:hypothetical protein